jgi:signal transduction histidine kinase
LANDESNLEFACHYPELEQKWPAQARKMRTTILGLPPRASEASAAADSFTGNDVVVVPDFDKSKYRKLFFEETQALIVAPVSSGDRVFGTIEVRFMRSADMLDHAASAIKLVGQQLGLYLFLSDQVERLSESQRKLARTVKEQQETFENLEHQIKTPLALAYAKARRISTKISPNGALGSEILALKDILRRADQVASNLDLFARLARSQAIKPRFEAATAKNLLERFHSAVQSFNSLSKQVHFMVVIDGFSVLNNSVVYLDYDLLDQMVDNMLDNAEKYSKPNTSVAVSGGLTRKDQFFFVSVSNKGLMVTTALARTLMQRGERADQAVWGRQPGSGLGLYLVNKILEAHRGALEIIPTDKRGITEFRLLFPVGPRAGV